MTAMLRTESDMFNNATFHGLYALFKAQCCAVCSIYYSIKTMEPDYIGPPPGDSCGKRSECLQFARGILGKMPREQMLSYRKKGE